VENLQKVRGQRVLVVEPGVAWTLFHERCAGLDAREGVVACVLHSRDGPSTPLGAHLNMTAGLGRLRDWLAECG
jgi:hypothetical protein